MHYITSCSTKPYLISYHVALYHIISYQIIVHHIVLYNDTFYYIIILLINSKSFMLIYKLSFICYLVLKVSNLLIIAFFFLFNLYSIDGHLTSKSNFHFFIQSFVYFNFFIFLRFNYSDDVTLIGFVWKYSITNIRRILRRIFHHR